MGLIDQPEKKVRDQLIPQIIGEQLSAVAFVQDYLELHFDGPKLTCYVFPALSIKGESILPTDDKYRSLLCTFITRTVCTADYGEGQQLVILFDDKDFIHLNLDPNNPEIVAEIAIFWEANGGYWVFD